MDKKNYELGNAEKSKLFLVQEENKYNYKLEEFKFDTKRKNDSHVAIINAIKENSIVLDIGCATGLIANILANEKNCQVDGIEYDKEAFEICQKSKSFRKVYHFSITDKNDEGYQKFFKRKPKYDYIILADILEHLVNPWEALINIYECLSEDGKIIISLPNVAHIDIIKGLLNGNFNYNNLGLLDTTHLRFFTFNSFCDFIFNISVTSNIFYNVERIEKIISIPSYVTTAKEFALYNINNYLEEYFILQNIIILTKSKDNKFYIKGKDEVNNNMFEKMLENYQFLTENNKKLVGLIKQLKIQNSDMKIVNNDLKSNNIKLKDKIYVTEMELNSNKACLNQILNSKRWRLMSKVCNFLNFFRIKRKNKKF